MGMHQDRSADLVFQQAATVSGTATEPLRTRLFLSQPPVPAHPASIPPGTLAHTTTDNL